MKLKTAAEIRNYLIDLSENMELVSSHEDLPEDVTEDLIKYGQLSEQILEKYSKEEIFNFGVESSTINISEIEYNFLIDLIEKI